MAEELDTPLSGLSCHVSVLEKFRMRQAGGHRAMARRGRALLQPNHAPLLQRPQLEDAAASCPAGISSALVRMIVENAVASLDAGVFDTREIAI
jgi:hypothetical protein